MKKQWSEGAWGWGAVARRGKVMGGEGVEGLVRSGNLGGRLVVAAGGLLWRGRWAPKLAMVHRSKYDDWSLPKGKLEPGETCEEAALREVGEETRCQARLGGFAGVTEYPVEAGRKLVLFWHMAVELEGAYEQGDDVDQVWWVTPGEACAKLTHEAERALVRREWSEWRGGEGVRVGAKA